MPIRDRLEELQQQRELLEKDNKKPGSMSNKKKKVEGSKTMQAFLGAASKIEENLDKMKNDVAEIRKLQQDMLSTPFPDKNDVVKYESLGEQVRRDAKKIGDALKEIEKKYDVKDLDDDSAFKRMKNQQLGTLSTQLNISTNEYFKTQAEYMDKMKGRLRRQLSARGDGGVDDEKINSLLDQDTCNVFTDNYIMDVENAEQTLRDLEERHNDIINIEKSVTQVNQLFKDMNLLISTQGETLVSIEDNIERTNVHVEDGNKQLAQANVSRKRARRKKFCICGILLIVAAVVGAVIAISIVTG